MLSTFKLSAAPALLAAASLVSTPVSAAEVPVAAPQYSAVEATPAWSPGDDNAARHRWYRHRNRVDTGDVLAGVLILGGIAAVASAASNANRDRYRDREDNRYRDRDDYRYRNDYRSRPDSRGGWNSGGEARGLDNAVQVCVDAIERDQRVETVDSVDRNGKGWSVRGTLFNGAGFTCTLGEDGRIEQLDAGSNWRSGEATPVPSGEDRQWGDDRYAAERARMEQSVPAPSEEPVDGDLEIGTGYSGAGTN